MAVVCKHVYYRGTVQGVGFRATVLRLAFGLPVAGYVRNLPDGRVELVAQGEASEVERFLAAIAGRMDRYIDGQDVHDEPAADFTGFDVRN